MQKSYMKGTPTLLCTKYSTISTNVHCTQEILNLTIFVPFSFSNYVISGGHILNISKTIFPKLILHMRIRDQLHDVRLQEFYIHSPDVKNHCI